MTCARTGRAVAAASTALRALGCVWHVKQRNQGLYAHTSIDPEADWTKSGWHGWIYGWQLPMLTVARSVWIPVAATVTRANAYDGTVAERLVREVPDTTTCVLGGRRDATLNVEAAGAPPHCVLVAPPTRSVPALG